MNRCQSCDRQIFAVRAEGDRLKRNAKKMLTGRQMEVFGEISRLAAVRRANDRTEVTLQVPEPEEGSRPVKVSRTPPLA